MQGMTIKNEIPSFFESTTKSIEGWNVICLS
jgi:hypothetical protein